MTFENFIGIALVALCFLPLFLMTWFVVDSINDKVKDIQKNINEICEKVKNINEICEKVKNINNKI